MSSTGLAAKDGNLHEGDIILKVHTHLLIVETDNHIYHIYSKSKTFLARTGSSNYMLQTTLYGILSVIKVIKKLNK